MSNSIASVCPELFLICFEIRKSRKSRIKAINVTATFVLPGSIWWLIFEISFFPNFFIYFLILQLHAAGKSRCARVVLYRGLYYTWNIVTKSFSWELHFCNPNLSMHHSNEIVLCLCKMRQVKVRIAFFIIRYLFQGLTKLGPFQETIWILSWFRVPERQSHHLSFSVLIWFWVPKSFFWLDPLQFIYDFIRKHNSSLLLRKLFKITIKEPQS